VRTLRARAALTVLALSALAGCGLAGHSTVQAGLDVGSGSVPLVRVLPPGPAPGADRDQIILGFVRAGAASDGAYDRAREFLTEPMAKQWSPDGPVVVVDAESSLTVRITGQGTARLTGTAVATISPQGAYTTLPSGTTRSVDIGFARIDGQWRIDDLPDTFGRWVVEDDVPRLFRPYAVHYVATDRPALVSDIRWFPLDHLTTRLARAQLGAVPAYLADAVRSEAPAGARLLADGVPVVDGVATVDLSARIPTDQSVREGLWAQFVATLTQVPGVASVALRVDGAPLDLPGVGTPVSTVTDLGFEPEVATSDAKALIRDGTQLRILDSEVENHKPAPRPSGETTEIPTSVTNLAMSLDGRDIAGIEAGRTTLAWWHDDRRTDVGTMGTALGNPSFDRLGYLWVGGISTRRGAVTRLWAIATDGGSASSDQLTPVTADWLAARRVVDAVVAPDGQRIAVLSSTADGTDTRIDVAGIVRGDGGRPERLTAAALSVGAPVSGFVGLTWLDNATLASMGGKSPTTLRPFVIGLGGDVRALSPTPNGVSLASTGGERAIRVVTVAGQILARAGLQWVDEASGTDVLVPGR